MLPTDSRARQRADQVQQVQAATSALLDAVLQGRVPVRPDLDGSGPSSAILGDLARLAPLVAVLAHTATGRRSNQVERAAAELAAALVALRDEPARHDLR
jgi:hypothetical protein